MCRFTPAFEVASCSPLVLGWRTAKLHLDQNLGVDKYGGELLE